MRHKDVLQSFVAYLLKVSMMHFLLFTVLVPMLYLSSYLMLPVCAHSVMCFCSDAQKMSQDYCLLASLAITAD